MSIAYSLDDQLIDAAFIGDVDEVRCLLAAGANPDAHDDDSRTALLIATADGQRELVRELLEAGANPNLRDQDGFAALDIAVYRRTFDLAWLLVRFGADTFARDNVGLSALARASLVGFASSAMLDLLGRGLARESARAFARVAS